MKRNATERIPTVAEARKVIALFDEHMDKMLSIEEGSRVKGRIDTNRLKKELEEAISHVLVDKEYTKPIAEKYQVAPRRSRSLSRTRKRGDDPDLLAEVESVCRLYVDDSSFFKKGPEGMRLFGGVIPG